MVMPTLEPPEQGFTTQGKTSQEAASASLVKMAPRGVSTLLWISTLLVRPLCIASAEPR